MGIRSQLRKVFSTTTPANIGTSMTAQGMDSSTPFSPFQPLSPYDGYSKQPRAHDFVAGYNIAARPRRNERVSFDTIRGLIDAYDVAQMCIWHRIDSVRSLDWNLVPVQSFNGDADDLVNLGRTILAKPDRQLPFKTWLAKFLYDVLAFDAGTLYRVRNGAGRVIGLEVIDGTLIAPLLDDWGSTPEPPAPAYVQFVQGLPWEWLTRDDIVYTPFRPLPNSPYGRAPIETVLLNANTDLRFQAYFLQRFTEGNVPAALIPSPESWTPDQIRQFQEDWDAWMLGDQARKQQMRFIPGGGGAPAWTNEKTFDALMSDYLTIKTCAAFHVTPADLGITKDVNRATGDTQIDVQYRIGDLPLIRHIEGILDSFLQDDLGLPLEFQFDTGQEKEDRLATAQADQIYIQNGVVSPSEIRQSIYGLAEPDGIPVPRYIFTARGGPIPLSALRAVAGPVDPESAAPAPGAPLPHKPFTPVEGVVPNPPPQAPALAVQKYPLDNPAAATAAVTADQATNMAPAAPAAPPKVGPTGVVKDATAGITTATGVFGDPLIEDDEEDEDGVEVAKELAAFRKFVKAREKQGKWRDFTFVHVPDERRDVLNGEGRALVLKAGDASPKARWREPSTRLPSHKYDLTLTDHYSPVVRAAIRAMFTDSQIRAAIQAARGTVAKAIDPSVIDTRTAARAALGSPSLNDLKMAVQSIWGDSYLAGSHVAAQMAGGSVVGALDEVAASVDWGAWQPGYAAAANKVASGGLADLLADTDVTLRGVADATVDQIGNRIANGVGRGWSVDQIAASLSDILDDPSRADAITNTETNRAMSLAAQDTYAANGIQQVTWLVSDPCDICAQNDGVTVPQGEDFPSGDSEPPAHPNCRCAIAPGPSE